MRSPTPAIRMRASCSPARRPASRWPPRAARTNRSARRCSAWASLGSSPSSRPSPTEVAEIMLWGFGHLQEPEGGALYCRLSTRTIDQPEREIDAALRQDLLAGGYWLVEPAPDSPLALVFSGAIAPEAQEAHAVAGGRDTGRRPARGSRPPTDLYSDLLDATQVRARGEAAPATHAGTLLGRLPPDAALVTVLDGHPGGALLARHRPPATAPILWASRASANPATSRRSTPSTGSIPTPSSTWLRWPASTAPAATPDACSLARGGVRRLHS